MVSEAESDQILMQRSACGDQQAFRKLVERYGAAVFGLAKRQLGRETDAEDVTQETFLRLFKAAGRYRPEVPLRSYLMMIAARLCVNRRARKESRELELVPTHQLDGKDTVGEESHPGRQLEQRQMKEMVHSALAALPPEQRLAVVLMRFEGLDCAEIARIMKRSVGAVHALLFRARNALRRSLAEAVYSGVQEVDNEPEL